MSAKTYTVSGKEAVPVDRVAARVMQPGYTFVPEGGLPCEYWDAPPETQEPPPEIVDLRGSRRGTLQIVGYLNRRGPSQHRWLARCGCGKYEPRHGIRWRRGLARGLEDHCGHCEYRRRLRSRDRQRRTGEYGDGEDKSHGFGAIRIDITPEQHEVLCLHAASPRSLVVKRRPFGRTQRELIALGLIAPTIPNPLIYHVTRLGATYVTAVPPGSNS